MVNNKCVFVLIILCRNACCSCFTLGLELLKEAIEKAGYTGKIEIGMDVAASEFCKDGKYDLDFKNPDSDKSLWVSIYCWMGCA